MKKILILLMMLIMSFSAFASKVTNDKVKTEPSGTEIILTEDNTVSLRTDFNGDSVGKLMKDITEMDSKLPSKYPIYLFLYTPGGSIQAGLEFYEFVKGLNRPIHTITLFAASMGFQTVQQLGKRYILKNGVLMSHQAATGGLSGDFSRIQTRFGLWVRRVEELDKDAVARTNGKHTLKSYQDLYQNELWMTGDEAVKEGFADEVVSVKCDNSLSEKTEDVEFSGMFSSVIMSFSKCPVKTAPISASASVDTNVGKMSLSAFVARNPQFKTCSDQKAENSYYSGTPVNDVICANDPTLNMEIIKEKISKQLDSFKGDIKNRIMYYQ
jgi:ATP-dependent protease ClpP protease subunit